MFSNNFRISHRDTETRSKLYQKAQKTFLCLLCVSVPLWPTFALFVIPTTLHAQAQRSNASAQSDAERIELHQALLDLTNPWTVMCVAAHPDDEDGATLTVLRRKHGAHTVTLFSTYGEGGQNAIGPELYEELGAIRARETLKASEIQGSEAHFLGLQDFGFSKSADEAFRIWGHDEALSRMVLQIRKLRPDVIITNHDKVRGHGHHQATGRLVEEAFDAAANPKRFPEQLKNFDVWQPQRLFVRVFNDSATGKNESSQTNQIIAVNPNELDAVRGKTYAEQALMALQQHATQGPWPSAVSKDGAPLIRYRLVKQANNAAPLPANAQTVLDGLHLPPKIAERLAPPTIKGQPLTDFIKERESILQALLARWREPYSSDTSSEPDGARFVLMADRLGYALMKASGLKVSIASLPAVLVPGMQATFTVTVSNHGHREINLRNCTLSRMVGGILPDANEDMRRFRTPLLPNTSASVTFKREIPNSTRVNLPHAEHLYDGSLLGEQFKALITYDIAGQRTLVAFATTSFDVAPAVQITKLTPSPYVLTPATLHSHLTFKLNLINYLGTPFKGNLTVDNDEDSIHEVANPVSLNPHEKREMEFKSNVIPVDGPDERRNPKSLPQTLQLSISAPDSTDRITSKQVRIVYSDAHVAPNLRVGYVPSFDETLRNALDALGVESKELTVADVRAGDLKKYDTIIIDNRGYLAHPELIKENSRLLDYVESGGTLIVFYHRTNEWNPDPQKNRPQLAPLPIMLGNERVTDENATVTFNEAQHPLLNVPNKISQEDFKGWVQERGLYFPKTWDARYRAPLTMHDAGEAPLGGGLLTLEHGRGRYIYTSMVWYRQLRAGIPGAYRMFANMISYGKN